MKQHKSICGRLGCQVSKKSRSSEYQYCLRGRLFYNPNPSSESPLYSCTAKKWYFPSACLCNHRSVAGNKSWSLCHCPAEHTVTTDTECALFSAPPHNVQSCLSGLLQKHGGWTWQTLWTKTCGICRHEELILKKNKNTMILISATYFVNRTPWIWHAELGAAQKSYNDPFNSNHHPRLSPWFFFSICSIKT